MYQSNSTIGFVHEKFALVPVQINVYQGVGEIISTPDSRFRPISVRMRPKALTIPGDWMWRG